MARIVRDIHVYVYFLSRLPGVDYIINFLARPIALKECYQMMNFEKNSF